MSSALPLTAWKSAPGRQAKSNISCTMPPHGFPRNQREAGHGRTNRETEARSPTSYIFTKPCTLSAPTILASLCHRVRIIRRNRRRLSAARKNCCKTRHTAFDAFGVRGGGSKMGPQAAPLSRLAHFCYICTRINMYGACAPH